ncbi:YaaR family protein [Neobacillus muris]|uniref:YaaR family protein n=1 Tax=Neobacillus muris TaxID=2941334 RepID=UPI00204107E0|nr:YaaR family protein [Neobacillus muris]
MKIQEPIRINRGDIPVSAADRTSAHSASFQGIMKSYSKELTQDRLTQLLQDIDQQGQNLSENPTFHQLKKYKDLVKQFMGEVSKQGTGLYQTETWNYMGGHQSLKTVRVLDQKLIELTSHVLSEQSSGLSILERIGEIKGLLINLYT